ncbi:CobW family GTP-binding protein [Paenibacillus eucommiae]|uniref:G3E family GTPase n=1 Tax=Paenibacillus eucommiae TaxID=1355755 RepID=A0ABS4IY74_9BACL|nr:GTP-binding protein [Paenibacillus eucommiae]MBP1992505.1 G3E family GTPase [Paenibacillus eucommiae]
MKIPVMVISGFLGSGKTTLLLRLLEETRRRGLQPGILMNELGKQDVDGLILDEHSDTAIEKLLDGCVCCSKKEELADCLKKLLGQKPDIVFIELTGVANPEEIADALTEPGLLGLVKLNQIITLLDAEHMLDYNSIFSSDKQLVRTLRRQMEVADLLIVNKTDLVTSRVLVKIEKAIRKHNEKAQIVYAKHSQIDVQSLLSAILPHAHSPLPVRSFRMVQAAPLIPDKEPRPNKDEALSYSRVQSITLPWKPAGDISPVRIEQFLHKWEAHILRAKGYVSFSKEQPIQLLQHAGKRTTWAPSSFTGDPYVVFIGMDLDQEQLAAEWSALLGLKPN